MPGQGVPYRRRYEWAISVSDAVSAHFRLISSVSYGIYGRTAALCIAFVLAWPRMVLAGTRLLVSLLQSVAVAGRCGLLMRAKRHMTRSTTGRTRVST